MWSLRQSRQPQAFPALKPSPSSQPSSQPSGGGVRSTASASATGCRRAHRAHSSCVAPVSRRANVWPVGGAPYGGSARQSFPLVPLVPLVPWQTTPLGVAPAAGRPISEASAGATLALRLRCSSARRLSAWNAGPIWVSSPTTAVRRTARRRIVREGSVSACLDCLRAGAAARDALERQQPLVPVTVGHLGKGLRN